MKIAHSRFQLHVLWMLLAAVLIYIYHKINIYYVENIGILIPVPLIVSVIISAYFLKKWLKPVAPGCKRECVMHCQHKTNYFQNLLKPIVAAACQQAGIKNIPRVYSCVGVGRNFYAHLEKHGPFDQGNIKISFMSSIPEVGYSETFIYHEVGHLEGSDQSVINLLELLRWLFFCNSVIVALATLVAYLLTDTVHNQLLNVFQLSGISYIVSLAVTYFIARQQEFQADQFVARTVGPKALIRGLEDMLRERISYEKDLVGIQPERTFIRRMLETHPSEKARIAALEKFIPK